MKLAKRKEKIIVIENNFEISRIILHNPNAKEAFNATNIEPKNNNLAEKSGKYIIEKNGHKIYY